MVKLTFGGSSPVSAALTGVRARNNARGHVVGGALSRAWRRARGEARGTEAGQRIVVAVAVRDTNKDECGREGETHVKPGEAREVWRARWAA